MRFSASLKCLLSIFMTAVITVGVQGQQTTTRQSVRPQTTRTQPRPPQRTGATPAAAAQTTAAQAGNASTASSGLDKKIEGPVIARNQDLSTVLQLLQTESGIQMVLGEGINKKVTFSLDNPSIRSVLETVLPANGLGYSVLESGIVRVDTIENINQLEAVDVELMTRTFSPAYLDVVDLEESLGQLKSPQGTIWIDNRSQQIIVEDIPEAIQAMEQLIMQLDVKMETRVFDLSFAIAEEVAEQLQGVLSAQEGKLLIDYRNNRLVITDTPERLDQAQAIIEQLDMELKFQVIPLAFALPEDVLPLVETLLTENGYVDYDPRTSRIIIQDIPSVVEQAVELINQLDIPTQQVWIEADIVTINDNKSMSIGTEAAFGSDIGRDGDSTYPNLVDSATGSGFFSFNPFLVTGSNGLTLMDVQKGNYRFQIEAMVEKEMAEIIASPRLLIQDGEIGSFTLGSEEPYATRSVYGGYYGSSSSDSYYQQTREVGTTIDLEVYASEAGYVEMFIMVEDTRARRVNLTNLGEALAVDGSFVDTVVTVKSGRTVVLGGIINRTSSQSQSGVPILSSIPILGNLFKKKSSEDDREKMLIFITPRIVNIDDPFDFAQVDNFQQMRNLQSKGVTKFVETTVDDKLLDWSNEQENEQKAIEEALRNNRTNSRSASQKDPSFQEQMDSGIIRVESKDE